MACCFGMIVAFISGAFTHIMPSMIPLTLGIVAMVATMIVRYYQVGVFGIFFFLMTAILTTYMPFSESELIEASGYFSLGRMLAFSVAFVYSLVLLKFQNQSP